MGAGALERPEICPELDWLGKHGGCAGSPCSPCTGTSFSPLLFRARRRLGCHWHRALSAFAPRGPRRRMTAYRPRACQDQATIEESFGKKGARGRGPRGPRYEGNTGSDQPRGSSSEISEAVRVPVLSYRHGRLANRRSMRILHRDRVRAIPLRPAGRCPGPEGFACARES